MATVAGIKAQAATVAEPWARRAELWARRAKPMVRWGVGHQVPATAMRLAARQGDLQARLIRESVLGDPWALLEEVRLSGAVHKGKFAYMTTSLPVVKEVLSSPDFSTGFPTGELPGVLGRMYGWAADTGFLGPLEPPSLLVTDGPDHTRYRKLVTRVFSVRAVEALRSRTEEIADALLDELAGKQVVDLVEAYCTLLPVAVISEILGVPLSEHQRVLSFGAGAAPSLDLGLTWKRFRVVESSLSGFDAWLGQHLEHLRAHPGDDLLSQLVAAQDEGVGLDERELKATAGLVLAAGFETTVNLLGNGTALLLQHPDQKQLLDDDPSLWPNAVDEMLRLDPPVLLTGRTAARDTEAGGTRIPKGSVITTILAAANRDPKVFADPARFDVTRENAKDHVSFSSGRHFCLGAALARMEGEVGLQRLFARYPDLAAAPGARRRSTRILRGYESFPVRLGARASVDA